MSKILIILISLFLTNPALAETIVLKSGETVEGKIVERTDEYIKIDIEGVPITYFNDEIKSLGGKPVSFTKEAEPLSEKEMHNKPQNPEISLNVYINKEFGIKLVFPDGWFIKSWEKEYNPLSYQSQVIAAAYKNNPERVDYEKNIPCVNLIVKREKILDDTIVLKAFAASIDIAAKFGKVRVVDPPNEISINGIKGIRAVTEEPAETGKVTILQVLFLGSKYSYGLELACYSENFPSYKADFEKVINSLEIK